MIERITIGLQRAAVILADSRSYGSAAEQLNISEAELRTQIAELEKTLSFEVFRVNGQAIEVTDAGALFVDACRAFLATRNQDH
jgi:DNA-binding transcriptional LysR family regulator